MIREMIAILDFGSQYIQLIARRVREHNVYSRIYPAHVSVDELSQQPLKGIILSAGKNDLKGAIVAWEALIQADPGFPQRADLERKINSWKATVR